VNLGAQEGVWSAPAIIHAQHHDAAPGIREADRGIQQESDRIAIGRLLTLEVQGLGLEVCRSRASGDRTKRPKGVKGFY
jgi:hypothetical protein